MTLLDALTFGFQTKLALSKRMGCEPREVEAQIQAARLAHVPIVSGPKGYRYALDLAEFLACLAAMRRRNVTMYATVRAMKVTAERLRQEADRPLLIEPPPPIVERKRDLDWPAWR